MAAKSNQATLVVTTRSEIPVKDVALAHMLAEFIEDQQSVFVDNWGLYDLDPKDSYTAEVIEP